MHSRSLRRSSWVGAGILLLALAGPVFAGGPRFWPRVLSSAGLTVRVAAGVWYSRYAVSTAAGPLSIHHLRIDLTNPSVRLGVGLAYNQLMSADETVSAMVRVSGALAGINGDYYDIGDSGMPLNIVVRDGRLLRSPSARASFSVGTDGTARIGRFRWTGNVALPGTGAVHALAGYNTGLDDDGLIAISSVRGYGAPVPGPGTRQTVVELVPALDVSPDLLAPPQTIEELPSRGERARYTVKRIWAQRAYYAPFSTGEILLLGRGHAAAWLRRTMRPGDSVEVNLTTEPRWRDVQTAIGGGPILLRNGRIVVDPDPPAPGERNRRYPVTAVGIARDGRTMLLVEVDGRQPRLSVGLTQPQLAGYLEWLGAFQAMAFDSGGSATMVVRFPGRVLPVVVNSPSDGRERPVADALLVFSTGASPPGPGAGPSHAGRTPAARRQTR